MSWVQRPENGWILHLLVTLLTATIGAGIGFIADPSNPLNLSAPAIAALATIGNAVLSAIRNAGMKTVPAYDIVPNSDDVIVPRQK